MRVKINKLFPYPILSEFSDSYVDNKFLCSTTFEYDSTTAYFKLQYTLNDGTVLDLLKEGKLGLYFIVDCSETKYRELFNVTLDENKQFTQEIPLERINGSFEIVSILMSREEIKNYQNDNLADFYKGESIVLPKYSIVGYTDSEVYFVNKKIDSNGDIPSIFTIAKDEEGKKMSFDPDGDIITIYLPKNEYEIYEDYKGKRKRLKQLMINFPILVNVLDLLKQEDGGDYSGRSWYHALDGSLISKGYKEGIESDLFKTKSATEIAQDLLGNLIQDAFADFDTIEEE